MAGEVIVGVLAVIAIVLIAWRRRKPGPQKSKVVSNGQADPVLVDYCRTLVDELHKHRDAALKQPAGSLGRKDKLEQAREVASELLEVGRKHPELKLVGTREMLDSLDGMLRAIGEIKPQRPLPREGILTVAFVDTETTGVSDADEPITLGLVLAEVQMPKGHLLREIDFLYETRKPTVPIHPQAARVHGLTAEDLEGKHFDMNRIKSAFERADVIIAHNANFDRRMIAKVIPEANDWEWRCSLHQVSWPDEIGNNRLDSICTHFSIVRSVPHNALADARALSECLFQRIGKTDRSRSFLAACLLRHDG